MLRTYTYILLLFIVALLLVSCGKSNISSMSNLAPNEGLVVGTIRVELNGEDVTNDSFIVFNTSPGGNYLRSLPDEFFAFSFEEGRQVLTGIIYEKNLFTLYGSVYTKYPFNVASGKVSYLGELTAKLGRHTVDLETSYDLEKITRLVHKKYDKDLEIQIVQIEGDKLISDARKQRIADEAQRVAEEKRRQDPEVSDQRVIELYDDLITKKTVSRHTAYIRAYRSTISDGYKPTHLPGFSSSLIVLDDSKTGMTPTESVSILLKPVVTNKKGIKALLDKDKKVILIQPRSTNVTRDILSQSKVESEYISEYSERHNQAYDAAYLEYQRAVANYNRVQATSSQPYTSTAKGAIIAEGLGKFAQITAANNWLNQAKNRLAQTPQTIRVPIKQQYSYNRMEVTVAKDIKYYLYIIDRASNKVLSDKFTISESRTFSLQYDKHPEDTGGSTLSDTEADVNAYEKQTINFSVDTIIANILETDSFKSKKYTNSLRFMHSPVKKKAVAKKRPKARSGKLSSLMQSVVAIQDNGGRTIGTGFFITGNLILTNRHVVGDRTLISVRTKKKNTFVGRVLDKHYDLDIALIEIDGSGTPAIMYLEPPVAEGEEVIAIGNPIGLEYSVTKGIISSIRKRRDKKKPLSNKYTYIQTDVSINPGNSGGPLFMKGKVVGINTSKIVSEDVEGIGFAIHYDEIRQYLKDNNVQIATGKAKAAKKKIAPPVNKAEVKLTRLKKMYEQGLITEDEYKAERAEVLESF